MKRRPFLIDTDTASDDAVAILMALKDPTVNVKAMTIVAGNVPVEQGAHNALYTAELAGRPDVPVYLGAEFPLVRPYEHAQWFHGQDGLGDMNYPAAKRPVESEHAVDAIIRTIEANPGIVLVTLGPLTNVALALLRQPSIASRVSRVVVMGGNPCCEGNVTPAAEYNIWVDPEAARIVFRAPWPVEMVGWHLCRGDSVIHPPEMERLLAAGPLGRFVVDANRVATEALRTQTGEVGISLPDPTAMAIAIDPTIATNTSDHLVAISTDDTLTRGQTVVDRLNVATDDRNRRSGAWIHTPHKSRVVWTMDVPRFKQMLFDTVTR